MKNIIKFLRRSAEYDMTQDQLAKALGVSRATIVTLENGKATTDEMIFKVSHFFNKDPREIFSAENVVSNLQVGNQNSA